MRHDFAGVVESMERLRAPLEYAWGVMSHLTGVKNSDPLRDAHQELQVGRNACMLGGFLCEIWGILCEEDVATTVVSVKTMRTFERNPWCPLTR